MDRIPHVFLIARDRAPRGRMQVIMELEIKTAEDSRQAIMRGRKQMPQKVVPLRFAPPIATRYIRFSPPPDFIGSKLLNAHLKFIGHNALGLRWLAQ